MDTRRKKMIALCGLGAMWGSLLLWQWGTWEEPARVPLTNVAGPAASASRHGTDNTLQVQLDLLAAARTQREMTFATPRNIFALPSAVTLTAASPPEAPDLLRQQTVATDLSQFHYLGFVRTGEEWQKQQDMAVLTKNDDLHVVKAGETIDKHVLVKTITQESVTLLDRDTRVEYTVLLSEEPQAPAP